MNEYETKVIDDYIEQLNNNQQQYQGYFNKNPQEEDYQDPFDAFFQDPFDQNIGSDKDKKDW